MGMINTFIRVVILYILILIIMRLMGKREIGQMQPFEFIIAVLIADLASIPIADIGVPLFNGIIPIITLLLLQLTISMLNLKSVWCRRIICGKPRVLVYKGRIEETALREEKFTINELQERLREKDVFNLGDVEYVILETSGQVTVIQKPEKRNSKPEDFNILPSIENIPYDLVVDGRIMDENLEKVGKDYEWLKKEVQKFKIKPEEALIVTYTEDGKIFCQERQKRGKAS